MFGKAKIQTRGMSLHKSGEKPPHSRLFVFTIGGKGGGGVMVGGEGDDGSSEKGKD